MPLRLLVIFLITSWAGIRIDGEQTENNVIPDPRPTVLDYPLDLETAIHLALKNDRSIQFGLLDQGIRREQLRFGVRKFLPEVGIGYSDNTTVVYGNPDTRAKRLSLNLNQLVYDAGKLTQELHIQERELQVGNLELQGEQEELVFAVVEGYIGLLKFDLKQAIQEETYRNAERQLAIAAEERRLGAITEPDFLAIQIMVDDQAIVLKNAAQEKRLLRFRFLRVIGLDPDHPFRLAGTINDGYTGCTSWEPWEGLRASYERRNLDHKRRQLEAVTARETLGRAERSWLPDLRARIELSMAGDDFPLTEPGFNLGLTFDFALPSSPLETGLDLGRQGSMERSSGFSASIQPLSRPEEWLTPRAARIALSRAHLALTDSLEQISFEIREQLLAIETKREILALQRQRVELEGRRLQVEELKVKLGEAKRIDLVESVLELAEQRIGLLDSVVELYSAEVQLLRLCGRTLEGPAALQTVLGLGILQEKEEP